MSKAVLLVKKSSLFALRLRYGMLLQKGGALPPGSIRVWGGKEYIKAGPGDWRLKSVSDKMKHPASLKDNIHKILRGTKEEKEALVMRHFYIADTPQFMKDKGLKGDFFTVRYGVVSRHAGKDIDHDLTEQGWMDLCHEITRPFAIARHGNGYNIFMDITNNGKWVMAGVMVQSHGKGLEVNAIRTVFGANSSKKDDIIYRSEKITPKQAAFLDGTSSVNSRPPGAR